MPTVQPSPAPATGLYYLTRADVATALRDVDPVRVAADTLRAHAVGRTELPEEAYLGWRTAGGHPARSLALPGLVELDGTAIGIKIINASLGNTALGLDRADGLIVLFDPDTARPRCVLDAALVSATRTAAVSTLGARLFAATATSLAVLGCGRQAATHLDLLAAELTGLAAVRVFDIDPRAATAFAGRHAPRLEASGVELTVASSAREAVTGARIVLTATVVSGPAEGYLEHAWLAPDALVLHVSLDDLRPEAVLRADTVVVDDWGLVRADHRRLLGRMFRDGTLCGPADDPAPGARRADGELADYLGGREPPDGGLVVLNPFGMAIQDVALAARVAADAHRLGLGATLAR